jgi:hypothetical protein
MVTINAASIIAHASPDCWEKHHAEQAYDPLLDEYETLEELHENRCHINSRVCRIIFIQYAKTPYSIFSII